MASNASSLVNVSWPNGRIHCRSRQALVTSETSTAKNVVTNRLQSSPPITSQKAQKSSKFQSLRSEQALLSRPLSPSTYPTICPCMACWPQTSLSTYLQTQKITPSGMLSSPRGMIYSSPCRLPGLQLSNPYCLQPLRGSSPISGRTLRETGP